MSSFFHLDNAIRDYAWGDKHLIYDFLGLENPENQPAAELWMGAHPTSPSRIKLPHAGSTPLDLWIAEHSETALGSTTSSRYGTLPFLFKLLAAGEALSIQAHPSKLLAEEGFRREEAAGIARDAAHRNYRDENHKPEIIMALTPFTAMSGFRHPLEIIANFSVSALDAQLASALIAIEKEVLDGIREENEEDEAFFLQNFLERLLTLDENACKLLINSALSCAQDRISEWSNLQCRWISRLADGYPSDIGVLSPLFLNVVELGIGEALYQGAGELHAYLDGFGVELMANSDNVLRGGLTPKHIDVPELLRVLDFKSSSPQSLHAVDNGKGIRYFPAPAKEFSLGLSDIREENPLCLSSKTGPMILLVLSGSIMLKDGHESLTLNRGESAFIIWDARDIHITGEGSIALAGIGQ